MKTVLLVNRVYGWFMNTSTTTKYGLQNMLKLKFIAHGLRMSQRRERKCYKDTDGDKNHQTYVNQIEHTRDVRYHLHIWRRNLYGYYFTIRATIVWHSGIKYKFTINNKNDWARLLYAPMKSYEICCEKGVYANIDLQVLDT